MIKFFIAIGLLFLYFIDLLSGGALSEQAQRATNWVENRLEHRGAASRVHEPTMDDITANNINTAIEDRRKSLYQRYK